MNELFAQYMPQTWFDVAGLRRSRLVAGPSATAVKRMRRWKNSVKGVSFSLVVSGALAIGSLSFAHAATASNQQELPLPPGMISIAPPPAEDASLGAINESFTELFAAFRSGTKLITNNRTRELATKAAARRHNRPEGWARKLAADVGKADD